MAVRESFDWEGVSHADGVPGPWGRSRREAMGGKKGHSNMRLAPERVARIQLRCRGWVGEWPYATTGDLSVVCAVCVATGDQCRRVRPGAPFICPLLTSGPSVNSVGHLICKSLLLPKVAKRPVQPDSRVTDHPIG
jgi:hypothetical protein